MYRQGSALSDAERRAVAEFLAGRPVGDARRGVYRRPLHGAAPPMSNAAAASGTAGAADVANTRFQPAATGGPRRGRRAAADAEMGIRISRRHSRVGAAGRGRRPPLRRQRERRRVRARREDRLHVSGRFTRRRGVRTALVRRPVQDAGGAGLRRLLRRRRRQRVRRRRGDRHGDSGRARSTTIRARTSPARRRSTTAACTCRSPLGEEGQGGAARYECCTFRGSLMALDATTGAVIWKTFTIPEEPKPRGKNKEGVQTWGPPGGGIWSCADDRCQAPRPLRRDRQRLRRSAAANNSDAVHRAGHGDRQDRVGEPACVPATCG